MDRLEHYRQCIQKLLIEDSKIAPINGEIEVETIFDKENDRYLVVDLGWDTHPGGTHLIEHCSSVMSIF